MLEIPPTLQARFEEGLRNKAIPQERHRFYKKWLRYYLDFCHKYGFPDSQRGTLPAFLRKLEEKKQTKAQREQAAHTIALYYEILGGKGSTERPPAQSEASTKGDDAFKNAKPLSRASRQEQPGRREAPRIFDRGSSVAQTGSAYDISPVGKVLGKPSGTDYQPPRAKQTKRASWQAEYNRLADEIQVRHYSAKTLKTYRGWVRKFQTFTTSKSPQFLSPDDVKAYLTFLAVKQKVAASTQNQAFNALLFFFRHVLHKEFGQIDGVVRAKRKPYVPTVLSRAEIDAILVHLSPPYDLVVKLLYGCGIRLFECLNLRVHCLNFDAGMLTVHDGKGKKDRTVPLPQTILPELQTHVESLKDLHQLDLDRN